jgi:hypothetical protein
MRRILSLTSACILTLAFAACGGNDSSTTAPSTPAPAAGTESFTATLAPGGTAIHQFNASATGTVSVTLTTTNPGSTLLGLGIGIPGGNIGGCDLTKTVQALPGSAAQLTASVEAGTYCAGAFDVGGVGRNGVLVTLSVAHP